MYYHASWLLDTMPIKVGNPGLVAAYLSDLKNARTEHVVVLTVASDNTLIKRHECAAGSASRASVDPGAVYQLAIADGARSVIIAHNHPRGGAPIPVVDVNYDGKEADTFDVKAEVEKVFIDPYTYGLADWEKKRLEKLTGELREFCDKRNILGFSIDNLDRRSDN